MNAIYTAEHVTKTFGHGKNQVTAAKDVSFELIERQTTTIVGESGSGKSTMARMVLGLMPVTSGKLTFQGKDVTHLKGGDRAQYWRDVQAVSRIHSRPQPFSPWKVWPALRQSSKAGRPGALEESLGYVGMDLSVSSAIARAVGGQRQRVMIARHDVAAKLLIADEATSMLDGRCG